MKRRLFISGMLLLATAVVIIMGLATISSPAAPVAAQTDADQLRTVQVSGRGQVSAAPDQAIVRLGVETEADTAQAALNANNERMTAVISATLEAGIEADDIQTQGFRLQPVYGSQNDNTQPPELVAYRASNVVQITVRDLDQLGELLDTAVTAGGNVIESLQFEVSNQAELEAAAREAAMLDAQQKAEQLVDLAGAELGPVQTIFETGSPAPVPLSLARDESAAAGVPVQPGTQTIEASVQVTWLIR